MKKGRFWNIFPVILALCAALFVMVGATFFFSRILFYVELGVLVVLYGFVIWRFGRLQYDIKRYLMRTAGLLNQGERDSLAAFPLPVVVSSFDGEIIFYNDNFRHQVLSGMELYGEALENVLPNVALKDLERLHFVDITLDGRCFTVYISPLRVRDSRLYVLYYVDNTQLKEIAQEYALSRPSVMLIYIDNIDEVLQNTRDSERAQIIGRVENLLEDWIGSTNGLMQKYGSDRFICLVEQRHLEKIVQNRFDILDRVRTVHTNIQGVSVTLSIGVGTGETMQESERMARQALEMSLGRGGDQASLKTRNGFEFYGGVSKGIEKRTKVRTRVIASALQELMRGSDNVLIMGHRYSDLDCLGSAAALATVARAFGRPAYVVTQREKTLAGELIDRYEAAGRGDLFIEPDVAMGLIQKRSLLIITDTHNPKLLEWLPLYQAAESVVVVDHHRRMVDCIENTVIFYHETYSSSASEMVAELVQYIDNHPIGRLEAEALLAGIMLDTRSFVMKAGVRTFEAAAYLRKLGADTVEVKRMFAGSMASYRKKADIVSRAYLYKQTAIACDSEGGEEVRIAAAQAADELLSIKGVDASFVLFPEDGDVNISARSLGNFNVQLVMEAIGGGGHLTMAGAYLRGVTMENAKQQLTAAIEAYLAERERSLSIQRLQQEQGTDG